MAELLGHARRATLSDPKAALTEVVWTEPALAQLQAIRAYIAQFNPRAAMHVAAGLRDAGNSLTHFPHRGRPALREPTCANL